MLMRRIGWRLIVLITAILMHGQAARAAYQFNVCLIVERGTNGKLFYDFDRSRAAVDLAVAYANDVILPQNFSLQTIFKDIGSTCTPKNHAMTYVIQLRDAGIDCDVFIGPGCGSAAESIYDYVAYYKILMIGCPSAGVGIAASLDQYPYLARISITHQNTASVLISFLRRQKYTSATILEDQDNSFYQQLSAIMDGQLEKAPDLSQNTKQTAIYSTTITDDQINNLLTSNIARSRVFLLLAPSVTVRRIMIAASGLGMTSGDYVYLCVNLFDSTTWGNFSYAAGDGLDDVAKAAFQSMLMVSLDLPTTVQYDIFAQQVVKLSAQNYGYVYNSSQDVDIITSHFYDAVIMYANMMKYIIRNNMDYTDGSLAAQLTNNFNFTSPVSQLVSLNSAGDRSSNYVIRNFDVVKQDFELFLSVLANGDLSLLGQLSWPDGRPSLPPNTPYCGFLGEEQKCVYHMPKSALAAAVAIPVVLVLVGSIAGTILVRRYLNSTQDPFWWRIFEHEITIVGVGLKSGASSQFASNMQSKPSLGANQDAETKSVDEKKEDAMSVASNAVVKRATYNGSTVGLRELPEPKQRVSGALGKSLLPIKRIQHNNVLKFYGIVISDDNTCESVVGDLCSKGSLTKLLYRDRMQLDWNFNCALFKDLTAGMNYLHLSNLQTHGNLSSHVCLIDSNFVLKIADYGLGHFRTDEELMPIFDSDENRDFTKLFWRSPELLRIRMPPQGTQVAGDIYAYAIILQQIVLRTLPFRSPDASKNNLTPKEILLEVKKGTMPPLRPRVPISSCPPAFVDLIEQCWDENPLSRPPFIRIRETLLKILGRSGDNIVDNLIRSMEKHAAQLEYEADTKMREFMEEKRRSDDILSQLLPKNVAAALAKGQILQPETFTSTTVHFSDVDGFGDLVAEAVLPKDTIAILNTLYLTCDSCVEKYDVYKVETVKDAYLIVSGLPSRNGLKHAGEIATLGLVMRREVSAIKFAGLTFEPKAKLRLRVGIHSGPCVAAVIGTKMPRYCLFGDTVNTSSRMESHGEPGKIQCSLSTKEILDKLGGYICFSRGEIEVKGKGLMETFWIVGKDSD
ncbi:atrial natriuretic peptide receptor 1-like [Paramacrobiotus metropolitanus]|uniref:atrial natriuretic peptide receptor 1-like n=1 Tax=Paramacrobiotus metropolitanus TaxID=2943436 RepID=UPI002445C2ED|nr:atrial natriuretic peptide receptor 1-like [Paramacrobiotus metropolitanus]